MNFREATSFQYPLRPGRKNVLTSPFSEIAHSSAPIEFVESTWYLYRVSGLILHGALYLITSYRQPVIHSTWMLGVGCVAFPEVTED